MQGHITEEEKVDEENGLLKSQNIPQVINFDLKEPSKGLTYYYKKIVQESEMLVEVMKNKDFRRVNNPQKKEHINSMDSPSIQPIAQVKEKAKINFPLMETVISKKGIKRVRFFSQVSTREIKSIYLRLTKKDKQLRIKEKLLLKCEEVIS